VKTANPDKAQPVEPAQADASEAAKYPRRTERRRRTRIRIQEVAAAQFSRAGFAATTMQAIADEADIHVTTLFSHFSSKNELATSLVTSAIKALRERALAARETTLFLDFFKDEALSFARPGRDLALPAASMWSVLRTDRELAFAWSDYEQGQKDVYADYIAAEYGLNRESDFLPDLVASLLVASTILPHRKWRETRGKRSLEEEISQSVNLGLNAARHMLKTGGKKALSGPGKA
jgi:AcrR family transcriptional regulator